MIFPNPVNWKFKAELKRPIDGAVQSTVTIVRTVSGLNIPIRCFLVNGESVGSCVFPDLCKSIMYITNLNKENCPANFKANGINCECPFNIPAKLLELEDSIPTYSPAFVSNPWILNGDFKIRVKAIDLKGALFCLDLAFTIKSN